MDTLKKVNYILDKKTKWKACGMVVLIAIGALFELVGVSVVLPVINIAVQPDEINSNTYCKLIMRFTGESETRIVILLLLLLMAMIYVIKAIYLVWMNNKSYVFATKLQAQISMRLMKAYLNRAYPFFLNKNSSEIIRGIASDTSLFRSVIYNVMLLVSSSIMSLLLFVYLLKTNLVITLLVGALSSGCVLLNIFILGRRLQWCGKENQKLVGRSYRVLFEAFHGVKETKILKKERYYIKGFEEVNKAQIKLSGKSNLYQIMPKYVLESVAICGILGYLAALVLCYDGYAGMLGQLSVFAVAAFKLLPAVNAIYVYIGAILTQKASVDLVYNDIIECEAEQKIDYRYIENPEADPIPFEKEIRIDHLSFQYSDAENSVLSDLNMVIPKGKSVGIVGVSGGGKTTTVDIILGLLAPSQGAVLVDGKDIREDYSGWLERIGYIPQDIYLTDASIKENIAYGIDEDKIDPNKLKNAIRRAQLEEFVESLPNGIETEVGEAGARLSGGQRQRIGIARALYNDPEILVLDEATSALDNSTEKAVMEAIEQLQGDKTLIIIAHRLTTVRKCDIIYEIRDGVAAQRESV